MEALGGLFAPLLNPFLTGSREALKIKQGVVPSGVTPRLALKREALKNKSGVTP